MSNSSNTTPTDDIAAAAVLVKYQKAINGLQSEVPATQQIVYKQVAYTPATFVPLLQAALAPLQAVVDARSALITALNNRHTTFDAAVTLINSFYALLPNILPPGADVSQFGAKPPKPRKQLTAEQKQAANVKRQATRAARHIMSKKQRLAITAPPATPPADPAAPPAPLKTGT